MTLLKLKKINNNNDLVIGLKPFVTIFHWDTPQALESKYGGFLSENIMYVLLLPHAIISD
jgi:hypothetical protein